MSDTHVACSSGHDYLPHAAAMIHSALAHSDRLVVHYLHGPSFSSHDAARLGLMFQPPRQRIVFHEIPDRKIAGLRVDDDGVYGPAMWYSSFLPELLHDIDRVLYLDADTLIVDRLGALWDLELGASLLAAVENVFMPYHRNRPPALGIEPSNYFNTGVLLMNLERMRADGFTEAVCELATKRRGEIEWPNQDAMNLVVSGRWLHLHPRWNVMNSMVMHAELAGEALGAVEVDQALAAPAIRHFEGPGSNKPWHAQHPRSGRRLYRVHRRATPWPRYSLDGDTWRRRIKRLAAVSRGS